MKIYGLTISNSDGLMVCKECSFNDEGTFAQSYTNLFHTREETIEHAFTELNSILEDYSEDFEDGKDFEGVFLENTREEIANGINTCIYFCGFKISFDFFVAELEEG